MNVICYCRVSTEDQKDNGVSLEYQEEVLRRYCEINKHSIIGLYVEDYSAKTFNRPKWQKILTYLKSNKGTVDLILCHKWDRFSRNQYDAMTTIKNLHKMGVTVNTVEQPLDLSNPDNKVLLTIYLTIPEVENDKNSIRTTECSRKARLNGCWTGSSPKGYINCRTETKKSTLKESKDAPLIIEAFNRMASGGYSADEVRRWLNSKGMKLGKQGFLNIVRNPVYMGKIRVKKYKSEPEQIVMGLHPALVTEAIYYRANDILSGRKRKMKFHQDKTDLYPLRGLMKCPIHGLSLTSYAPKGRKGELYHYYLCPVDRCRQRHRVADVHKSIEDILSTISVQAQTLTLYTKILEKLFEKEDTTRQDDIHKAGLELEKLRARKENALNMFVDGKLTATDYQEIKQKVEKEMVLLTSRLEDMKKEMTPYKTYIKKTVPMLADIVSYYRKANGETKKKILACIFAEKLVLEKGKVASTPFTTEVQVLLNTVKGFQRSQKKQGVDFDALSTLAPPAGLEPATL
jgi:site-specific DNA recombinase